MSDRPASSPRYATHHPRWLRTRVSTWWWLQRRAYFKFILRELSSVCAAWFVIYLLLLVRAVSRGEAAWRGFLDWAAAPLVVVVNVVSLFFLIFHAITWFNLAPRAMVVKLGGKKVPGVLIAASNYAAWAVATALVAWLLVGR
jgi:fumarate reductase subunit C